MKKVISLFIILSLFFIIILLLPDNFPIITGIDSIAWEVITLFRYYLAKCYFTNISYIWYPYSHPFYTFVSGIFYNIFSFLPVWKQMFLYNFGLNIISSFLLYEIVKDILKNRLISIVFVILFIIQLPITIWAFSGFAYNTGIFLLVAGTFVYYFKGKNWGILFFAFLPLVRTELAIFMLAPFLSSFKRKNSVISIISLVSPFLFYYVVWSYYKYDDVFYIFFIHTYLSHYDNVKLARYFTATRTIKAFFYYNPIFWIGLFGIFLKEFPKKIKIIALNSLLILLITYSAKTIIPGFIFAYIGFIVIFNKFILTLKYRYIFVMFLIFSQLLYFGFYEIVPESGDTVIPYKQTAKYQWINNNYNNFDYLVYTMRNGYFLWNDKECKLSHKIIFVRGNGYGTRIMKVLLPSGKMLSDDNLNKFIEKNRVISVSSLESLTTPVIKYSLKDGDIEILEINGEKGLIIYKINKPFSHVKN